MIKDQKDDSIPNFVEAIQQAADDSEIYDLYARWILHEFDQYYSEFRAIPTVAKLAFEERNPGLSVAISRKRLSMYSLSMRSLGMKLQNTNPFDAEEQRIWDQVESRYWQLIRDRYEADLALAYIQSVRRFILRGEWKPVAYSFGRSVEVDTLESEAVIKTISINGRTSSADINAIVTIPDFEVDFRNLREDLLLSVNRINDIVDSSHGPDVNILKIEIFDAGFYRNRGVYIVGRMILDNQAHMPLIFALLNDEHGIYIDAILHTEADAHNLFSSTLANFHVTTAYYHELAGFLHKIMPERPIGLHYTTIGYNHFGKVAVMNELRNEVTSSGEVFNSSPGFKGTVAVGFATPSSNFNLKIIRDKPTADYKWGTFEGVEAVLRKYSRVHDINRTGSMLDNIIYHNVKLDKQWFDMDLLEELLSAAPNSVSEQGDGIIFKHLIVQIKMIPLPVFLADASMEEASKVIVNLGHCIKNNMAANIFNKDLDARNYGVSRYLKVYLFDYDALENFMDVKIRTNVDRFEGEEDVPDWYFEEGVVFLPEEIESGLRIPNRSLTRLFRHYHGDLLSTQYWENIQDALKQSAVPRVRVYPEERELR